MAEDSAQEVALPAVDPASVEIVTAPKTSAWLVVSTEGAEVSPKGFFTEVPLGVVASAAAVSPVRLLAACGVSADSVVLSVDEASEGGVVLVRCGFALVKSGKADVSGADRVFPPVGLWSMPKVPGRMAVSSISTILQLVASMLVIL